MAEERPPEIRIRDSPNLCPYCQDTIANLDEAVACAACGARHHAACRAEHGSCAACDAAELLVSRSHVQPAQLDHPPEGSRIKVELLPGGTVSFGWREYSAFQACLMPPLMAISVVMLPLIPIVLYRWIRHKRYGFVLGEDELELRVPSAFGGARRVRAKRGDVREIQLKEDRGNKVLTVDMGIDNQGEQVLATNARASGITLTEFELEWLHAKLLEWKGQGPRVVQDPPEKLERG